MAYPGSVDDHPATDLDRLARDLGVLVRRLIEASPEDRVPDDVQVGTLLRAHLGDGATTMPVARLARPFPSAVQ